MYSHGFGALFLAEAYGMSRRPELREKLTNADPPDHRHPERRRGLALPAGPRRRRHLGDDLPDQRPPRRAERRPVRPQGDGRELHPLRQAGAECQRRRLPLHAIPRRQRLPPVGAGVVALYSASVYDSKEVERGVEYLKGFITEIQASASASATTSTVTTTRLRRCGFEAGRTGTCGTRRSATS